MKTYLLALAGLSLVANAERRDTTNSTRSPPIVDLGYVKYVGYTNATAGVSYFRGIKYAQAPSGALRWQKPVPIEMSKEYNGQTINVTQIGPACYQSQPGSTYEYPHPGTFAYTPQGQSEDCLTMDILVPNSSSSTSLPVMVQIHGGGYTSGNSESFPGTSIAASGEVIYISIQYRLGIFGFLAGGEVAQNGVLNAGLLDQRAALEWVQRNIRAFGGDPTRVTIQGGSAGGGSVTMQLIAGGAYDNPPFSAAIAEYPWWQPFANASEQENQFNIALRKSDCSSLACLRNLSSPALANLGQTVLNASYPGPDAGYGVYTFGPVVDGKFVRALPGIEFKRGNFYHVPLLVDHDEFEGAIFTNMSLSSQIVETTDAEDLFPFAGPSFFSRLYQLYPASAFNATTLNGNTYSSTFWQRQTWFGDFIINCPTYFMASAGVDRNGNSSAVFKLTFAAGDLVHGATAAFLWSSTTGYPEATNVTLAKIMTSYWVSFTVHHDPNPLRAAGAPFWPSYISGGNGTVSDGESVGFTRLAVTAQDIVPAFDADVNERCEFFGNNGYDVMN